MLECLPKSQVVTPSCVVHRRGAGVLIDTNIIATAAHCITAENPCSQMVVAFGATTVNVDRNVAMHGSVLFTCVEVLGREYTTLSSPYYDADWAVFRIDRHVPISVAFPVPVGIDGPLRVTDDAIYPGTPVVMIGHP